MDVKKWILVISLLTFSISLCFTAFKIEDLGKIEDYKSYILFLVGPISCLGGGILEFFIWTANIWFFISIIFSYKNSYLISFVTGLIASVISVSFFFWKEVLAAENGRMGRIYSLEIGYFLWVASILLVTFGSIYLCIKYKSNRTTPLF